MEEIQRLNGPTGKPRFNGRDRNKAFGYENGKIVHYTIVEYLGWNKEEEDFEYSVEGRLLSPNVFDKQLTPEPD